MNPTRFALLALALIAAPLAALAQTPDSVGTGLAMSNGSSAPCPPQSRWATTRPHAGEGVTEVEFGVVLVDINEINDVDQSITVDFYQVMRWTDPRLADPARGNGQAVCNIPADKLWRPQVQTDRLRSIEKFYDDMMLIDAAGRVTLVERFYLETSAPLDLADFPFDEHEIEIGFASVPAGTTDVLFVEFPGMTGRIEDPSISGWELGEASGEVAIVAAPRLQTDISWFYLRLPIIRDAGFFLWKSILPLTIIIFMSWAVFWIPPDVIPSRIGLAATSMLSMIAYLFALSSILPRISYLTRADKFTIGAAVLIFLALVVTTFASALGRKSIDQALLVDRSSRIVFPLAFLFVTAFSFWL